MECGKCHGLMVCVSSLRFESSGDYRCETRDYADEPALKCVNCSDVVDPVILRNRARQLQAVTPAETPARRPLLCVA